ncbi:hypothetical protein [Pseudooceanicola onchidii]|uniref:hypothetical protein n=1 Tax=Pseudooceanicola onchidii TaxID=2562279 RepID=UPI0010AB4D42|nr:hypothetical protein [Pseudooceanicola onchidii]
MKTFVLAACTAGLLGTASHAGSYSEPMIEAPVIVEETTSSSSGITLVMMIALIVAVGAAG